MKERKPDASSHPKPQTATRNPLLQQGGVGVYGEVRDIFERPISGARVQIQLGGKRGKEVTTLTNSQGKFRIPLKNLGILFIFVSHPDFSPLPKPLFLEPKPSTHWVRVPKITLLSGKKLEFRFLGPGGQPISGVRAILQETLGADRGPFGDPPKEALSDTSGIVQFLGLSPNSEDRNFQLRILPPTPWMRSLLHTWMSPPGGGPITITLSQGTRIRGRVEDAFGRPSAKAEVRALPLESFPPPPINSTQIQKEGRRPPTTPAPSQAQSPIPHSVFADEKGRFTMGGLPQGSCLFLAHPSSPKPRIWTSKKVLLPTQALLLLQLPKGGKLDFQLPAKFPFSSFAFLRSSTGRSWNLASSWKKIPENPRFHRKNLPREILRIRLQNPLGFDFTTRSLDFETLERLDLDLGVLEAATLKGWLKGKGKKPLGGPLKARFVSPIPQIKALGTISRESSLLPLNENGQFVLGPIPAGTYEILWGARVIATIDLKPGDQLEKTFFLP